MMQSSSVSVRKIEIPTDKNPRDESLKVTSCIRKKNSVWNKTLRDMLYQVLIK